jgi:ribose 5-phosphate isomerase A
MLSTERQHLAKAAAGRAAAALAKSGMCLGLGTGSTTAYALIELGRRIREEDLDVVGVPTSFSAEILARKHGIPITNLDQHPYLDLALDGADEIDPALNLIKGRGAAQTREKVVATQAERFIILADPSKMVKTLGTRMPVPVEVLPMAVTPVMHALKRLGSEPALRIGKSKDGPVVTDQGFWIIDAHFDGIQNPSVLNDALLALPGVLDHGLFIGLADEVFIGHEDGNVEQMTTERSDNKKSLRT